ncbi:MAG: N-acetyl-anhydromuranmyl-L-alanine amidase [Gammaproteobacteria bacterium RIFCSPHIGHO2_12_FULL_38_14]|nr:MAG: N-acetyl-anhydromuranmyl-L-alanine amidase [Gammaproteobacteria bacterium RIFCSPHIGHO2_12_FULL_38_14]
MLSHIKIDQSGLLTPVLYRPSPHCDDRPFGDEVNLVVIHGISLPAGQFGTDHIEHFFCGTLDHHLHPSFSAIASLRVSAHILIKRDGQIVQFVPFTKRAWHAGESFFQGRVRCNDFSIGIELEGTDHLPYEKVQYDILAQVLQLLINIHPAITIDRIVGHADIAPGRKTDPGPAFDWAYIKGMLL